MSNGPRAQFSRQRISPGTRLNGIYEVSELIAIGGMGEVYKGRTVQTGDPVAIKLMLPEFAENEAALALFRREASALHRLHHEAIIRYYVFTIEPELRRPYLAMEFVDGRSLSEILHDDGPLTFEAVQALTRRIAAGLHAAHTHGIIHRDVSPDNIIVPGGDVARAKIIDFGIARSTQVGDATVIGSGFAGKYNYVSPEQLGLFGGNVTAKSDIYSLGLVLAQALTGHAIDMGGTQVQIVEKRRHVPDIGAIDMRLRPLLERMLQPNPDQRPDSMATVADWSFGAKASPKAASVAVGARADAVPERRRSRGWRYAAATLALLVILGGAGGYYYYAMDPSLLSLPPAPTAGPALSPANEVATQTKTAPKAPPTGPSQTAKRPTAPVGPADDFQPQAATTAPAPTSPPATGAPSTDKAGSGKIATLPPKSPVAPPVAAKKPAVPELPADRIMRFVLQYDGGECFFITPVAVSEKSAAIEGLGASMQPFHTLDQAFKRDHGFEADIGVRQVTSEQCPAVTFLARLRRESARAPRLDIDKVQVRDGDILSGMVDRFGSRNVDLLLVSDGGMVQNISSFLKPGTDAKSFSIGMRQRDGVAGSQPQLLMAVASARPLTATQPGQPMPAGEFFAAVLAEAARQVEPVAATARYFRLER